MVAGVKADRQHYARLCKRLQSETRRRHHFLEAPRRGHGLLSHGLCLSPAGAPGRPHCHRHLLWPAVPRYLFLEAVKILFRTVAANVDQARALHGGLTASFGVDDAGRWAGRCLFEWVNLVASTVDCYRHNTYLAASFNTPLSTTASGLYTRSRFFV